MKKISFWVLALLFTASVVSAQDAATQQQLDKLTGQIQDLTEAQSRFNQRLDALERELNDLRDKANTPVVTDYATHAELKELIEKMREIDDKRKDDTENTAHQIKNLADAIANAPTPAPPVVHHSTPKPDKPDNTPAPTATVQYEYEVHQGDSLGLILKAYRQKGVKVSRKQVIAANPKMNPEVLIPGEKIIIPDFSTK